MIVPLCIVPTPVTLKRKGYVFIDGGYIRGIIRNILRRNDILNDAEKYAKFLRYIINNLCSIGDIRIVRTLYYDAIPLVEKEPEEHKRLKEFFNKLQLFMSFFEVKLGDLVKTGKGEHRQKGVDTLIAIDMITKAYLNHYDVAILVAGDRDFVNVVKAVKEYTGKTVYGICELSSTSEELLRIFDWYRPIRKEDLKEALKLTSL